jgi:hypothetical protein
LRDIGSRKLSVKGQQASRYRRSGLAGWPLKSGLVNSHRAPCLIGRRAAPLSTAAMLTMVIAIFKYGFQTCEGLKN